MLILLYEKIREPESKYWIFLELSKELPRAKVVVVKSSRQHGPAT